MDAKELERKFTIKQLMSFNAELRSRNSDISFQYNNLVKKQDQIIENKVNSRIKIIQNEFNSKLQEKDQLLEEKDMEIELLKDEIKKRQRIIDNNASNSGIPTSKTPIGKKKHVPNTRVKTGKMVGGQTGHTKHKLYKFNDEEITENISVTLSSCPGCNGKNINIIGEGVSKDETDYDVKVIKRRYHFKNCSCLDCKKEFRSPIPRELKEENQYGNGVQALAVCLTNETYTPFNKTRQLISGLTENEINVSEGYIAKLQPRGYSFLEDFEKETREEIIKSSYYAWDDSVINIDGKNACLRVYCNDEVSLFYAHESKSRKTMDEDDIFINTLDTTTVMHDHLLSNYHEDYRFKNVECMVHLNRRLEKMDLLMRHKWARKLKEHLVEVNLNRNILIAQEINSFTKEEIEKIIKRYDDLIRQGEIENLNDRNKEEKSLLKDLKKYKENYLLWIHDFGIPSTNNLSERNLRPIKSKMKISGQFKNINYARYYARIRSYIETCKKSDINIIHACERLMLGNPFTLKEILMHKKND